MKQSQSQGLESCRARKCQSSRLHSGSQSHGLQFACLGKFDKPRRCQHEFAMTNDVSSCMHSHMLQNHAGDFMPSPRRTKWILSSENFLKLIYVWPLLPLLTLFIELNWIEPSGHCWGYPSRALPASAESSWTLPVSVLEPSHGFQCRVFSASVALPQEIWEEDRPLASWKSWKLLNKIRQNHTRLGKLIYLPVKA